ncbi:hypothetical protein XH98_32050 [Bradyrhizobium sp. CCBAU 51745]|nr:hypothetical protein [Bradyrhizobium sp. CCBAU 51745]
MSETGKIGKKFLFHLLLAAAALINRVHFLRADEKRRLHPEPSRKVMCYDSDIRNDDHLHPDGPAA